MNIPPELTLLIERLNQELSQIEQEAAKGLNLVRISLDRFPNNLVLTELFAFLNTNLFYVQRTRIIIKERLNYLRKIKRVTDEDIEEAGQEFSMELGRAIETKIRVTVIIQRLEG